MESIYRLDLEGESLTIDNKRFVDCTFTHCILEYSGSPVSFERTRLHGCRYVFYGKAKRTVVFLQNVGLMPFKPSEWAEFPDDVN